MDVMPIRKIQGASEPKIVEANQKAIDALPLDSGSWKVEGLPGLYIRCRTRSRSFFLHRRIEGKLVKETLGELPMKQAKALALKSWGSMKPKTAEAGKLTLEAAIDLYAEAKMQAGKMSQKTKQIAIYNRDRYLAPWKLRALEDIGNDRTGVRLLGQKITKAYGRSTSNQVIRLLSAVYKWQRIENPKLPAPPFEVAEIHAIKARDWAYSPDELRRWWVCEEKRGEKTVRKGVSTLGPIKRMWWITALLTGARKGSIEALRWSDVDLENKVVRFVVTKGDRPYSVPVSDLLADLLKRYRERDDVPPTDHWIFPSPTIEGAHIVNVKNRREGVDGPHRLRHTYRTTLAALGATADQACLLMGHSLGGHVSRGYITPPLLVESLRPLPNAVAQECQTILGPTFESAL